ncbi:ornithine carbamoyltransferase [Gracilibacillus sp. D59]|uniref:ornithine carbamoyltransferase n=1 Tax=Gracilibacillus sp. D59 TaxID=3457434 RepID=UPI003FCD78B4
MKEQLKGRSLLTLADYSKAEIAYILELAMQIKQKQKNGELYQPLKGKTLGMIFEKSSTRTRVSFETGIYQLGGMGLFLSSSDIQLGRGEPISDTAKVLSGYLDGMMIRTFSQLDVEELAINASVPVINGLTDDYHPCQVLADLQTIKEEKGKLEGLKLAYIGDGNNMAHSLMIGCAKMGLDVAIAAPQDYQPKDEIVEQAQSFADGSEVLITEDAVEAVKDADVIYSDVWASMGQEEEQKEREKAFAHYQVNKELFSHAKQDAIFMHCLPAHREEEVTAEIIDGPQSVVFQEAENRLHAQKALMVALMG